MLRLERLRITQGDFHLDADLEVPGGAICAVVGPSGAGKSTLLNVIAGFFMASEGRVLWNGAPTDGLAPGDRPVSIVFQDNNLFPHLTAFRNVALGMRPSLKLAPEEIRAVEDALSRVGLEGLGDRRPGELSGGQQSRVALARVLVRRKPIMLLDEPFSALGPALRTEMLDLVKAVAAETGATVLMVSHDPDDALWIADLTIYLGEGRAHPPVPTETLFAAPPPALAAYLGERKRAPEGALQKTRDGPATRPADPSRRA
jgi:thiamine transport system ATP-binding protein